MSSKAPNYTSTQNACKLCSPLGASLVYKGIKGCIPLIHGSQGCSTYIRRYMISHFREPLDIASTNFHEAAAVMGGAENMKVALDNLIRQYNPEAIGIATTCLSETIGDDINLLVKKYSSSRTEQSLPTLLHCSTPSYSGTHMNGYRLAVLSILKQVCAQSQKEIKLESTGSRKKIGIFPALISPADLRFIKSLVESFSMDAVLVPDYSDTLDGPTWDEYTNMPPGGTSIDEINSLSKADACLELGNPLDNRLSASLYMEEQFGVKAYQQRLPIGIEATDRLIHTLSEISGKKTPASLNQERGRLTDAYIDAHKVCFDKRVLLFGDEELALGLTSFLTEIGAKPVLIATGAVSPLFRETVGSISDMSPDTLIEDEMDFVKMLEMARDLKPDIILGSSKGYYLSRELQIPLVRAGFPIHDRFGGQRLEHLGYHGTLALFDRFVNTLLESKQETEPVGYTYFG